MRKVFLLEIFWLVFEIVIRAEGRHHFSFWLVTSSKALRVWKVS